MAEVDEPIHLCAYNPAWPALAAAEAGRIAACLPTDILIEHIGSTAVPDLVAKPIVDLMVGYEAHHSLSLVRAALTRLAYEDMGEAGVPGRLYFRRRNSLAFNIALVERDGHLWTSNIALRDYLREHPEAAREYAEIKLAAFDSGIRSLLAYSSYKNEVLTRLINLALKSA